MPLTLCTVLYMQMNTSDAMVMLAHCNAAECYYICRAVP
jgi:hypothetical protein